MQTRLFGLNRMENCVWTTPLQANSIQTHFVNRPLERALEIFFLKSLLSSTFCNFKVTFHNSELMNKI